MYEEEEGFDHTSGIARAVESDEFEDVHMILGDREKVRYAGVIRGGVKVPKKSCSADEIKLFKELEEQGMNYDDIDRKIGGEPKSAKSKLVPKNVDHFVIRDEDFNKPADAQMIRKKYADTDGKVRRIPIWFATGDLERVIPHSFKAFDGGENLRATSYYKGDVLTCRFVPKGVINPKKDEWQEKPCNPDNCSALAGKKCSFGGFFRFNIPGVKGIGGIIVPTKSWYGLGDAVAVLKKVRELHGRFDGLFQDQTFLELVKVPETVRCPDGSKKTQFIITLELSIDPMELAMYNSPQSTALRASAALRALTGAPPVTEPVPFQPVTLAPVVIPATETEIPLPEEFEEKGGDSVPEEGNPPAGIVPPEGEPQQEEETTHGSSLPSEGGKKSKTPISEFQKKHISKELAKHKIPENTFTKCFLLEQIGDLDKNLFNEAMAAISRGIPA